MTINQDKLGELLGTFVTDLGATISAGNVVVGHRLGLYRSLADAPATAEQLAQRTGTDPRYIAEWLRGQAAGGYVSYDPASEQFSLTDEQAYALADPDGLYLPGAFVLALGALRGESQITDAFRTGAGMGWHEHHEDVFSGCEMFFRPGYVANLISSWIPALDGVADKLNDGGRVADVGCGWPRAWASSSPAWPPTPNPARCWPCWPWPSGPPCQRLPCQRLPCQRPPCQRRRPDMGGPAWITAIFAAASLAVAVYCAAASPSPAAGIVRPNSTPTAPTWSWASPWPGCSSPACAPCPA